MKELSLHILDITQNSITAQATLVVLEICESDPDNQLIISIKDNGKGIEKEQIDQILDPFVTSRTTRKVGLGLPLFKAAADQCGGHFEIESQVGVGTRVRAEFEKDHIDRVPLGNMADTVMTMVMSFGPVDLVYTHTYNQETFNFDTRQLKEALETNDLNEVEILTWIRETVSEGLENIMEETKNGKIIS